MPFLAGVSTATILATTAAVAGAGMTALSSIASGNQQAAAAKAQAQGLKDQAKAAEYNRQVAELGARNVEKAGEYEVDKQRQAGRKLLGAQKAGFGAAGVEMAGTPLEVMASTAADLEMEAIATRYNYAVDAARYRSQAGFFGFEAERQRSMADITQSMASYPVTRGYLGAGTALLTTGAALFGKTTTKSPTSRV